MLSMVDVARYMPNGTTTSPNASAPGNAISGGYSGDSFAVKAIIIFLTGLSMYNVVELLILIFFTFTRFSGLYFYSLLISSVCVLPYALGFLFKYLMITTGNARWLAVTFITIGWYGMVTGQSVVLWSRLHLLVDPGEKGQWTLKWTKWMIVTNAIVLHIPTTVLTYGSNGDLRTDTFVTGYNVMEKIQMCGFFLQEVTLSSLYIAQAAKLLRNSMRNDSQRFFIQLLGINVLIIIMDLGLLATEAASLYLYETIIKGTIYSIKLKLEFAVLGKLVHFVGGQAGTGTANEERWRRASVAFVASQNDDRSSDTKLNGNAVTTGFSDLGEFVDLSKVKTNISYASNQSNLSRTATAGVGGEVGGRQRQRSNTIRAGRGVTEDDIDLARFEHVDDARLAEQEDAENTACGATSKPKSDSGTVEGEV